MYNLFEFARDWKIRDWINKTESNDSLCKVVFMIFRRRSILNTQVYNECGDDIMDFKLKAQNRVVHKALLKRI